MGQPHCKTPARFSARCFFRKVPSNKDIDFTKLQDIMIIFTYTYGNPPECPNL